ncbi:hypothetical protein DRW03_21050 [Corallococcus sp. H22C18031201]|nr:hypothetical protein DRW03_21050 [Corallococcus sp. H22C18031201]
MGTDDSVLLIGARCAEHPERGAVVTCARCGRFLCGDCLEVQAEDALCGACVVWLREQGSPSRAVTVWMGVNFLGLALLLGLLFPLGAFVGGAGGLLCVKQEARRVPDTRWNSRAFNRVRALRGVARVNLGLTLVWLVVVGTMLWTAD